MEFSSLYLTLSFKCTIFVSFFLGALLVERPADAEEGNGNNFSNSLLQSDFI